MKKLTLNITVNVIEKSIIELKAGVINNMNNSVLLNNNIILHQGLRENSLHIHGPSSISCRFVPFRKTVEGNFILLPKEYKENSIYISHICNLKEAGSGSYQASFIPKSIMCNPNDGETCAGIELIGETSFDLP